MYNHLLLYVEATICAVKFMSHTSAPLHTHASNSYKRPPGAPTHLSCIRRQHGTTIRLPTTVLHAMRHMPTSAVGGGGALDTQRDGKHGVSGSALYCRNSPGDSCAWSWRHMCTWPDSHKQLPPLHGPALHCAELRVLQEAGPPSSGKLCRHDLTAEAADQTRESEEDRCVGAKGQHTTQ